MTKRILSAWAGFLGMALTLVCVLALAPTTDAGLARPHLGRISLGVGEAVCGNDVVESGEECDDGNTNNGDGCNDKCQFEKCGDGVLNEGEECDDGNNDDGDGCSADCRIEKTMAEGCTPGFWKNHTGHWVGYAPGGTIGSVFSAASAFPTLADDSLLAGLQYHGGTGAIGGARILLRAAIAALLNESHPSIDYSVDGVIGLVNAALATGDRDTMINLGSVLDDANNGQDGCPLSGGNTNH